LQLDTAEYAGFWRRFGAFLLDWVIAGFPLFFVSLVTWRVFTPQAPARADSGVEFVQWIIASVFVLGCVGQWLYFAVMESSSKQATIGKLALKIQVTDVSGNRVSFGRASARYFAKYISGVTFLVGYIMAAFTKRNQALHDFIAGTIVTRTL